MFRQEANDTAIEREAKFCKNEIVQFAFTWNKVLSFDTVLNIDMSFMSIWSPIHTNTMPKNG